MKIKIANFALRHFDPKFGGTKILNMSSLEVETVINSSFVLENFESFLKGTSFLKRSDQNFMHGYAPFCKLVAIKNFTDAKVGSLPITLENYQYIRSGYSARTESELPIFSRWLDLPLGKPKAEWLIFVLYSKEQMEKETKVQNNLVEDFEFDADWGVVAVLGQSHPEEEPMKPETMIRNALGIEEGGSGVPLDREKYLASVEFWQHNATVK